MKNFVIAGPCVLENYDLAEDIMLFASKICIETVSYTHLTLPTTPSV